MSSCLLLLEDSKAQLSKTTFAPNNFEVPAHESEQGQHNWKGEKQQFSTNAKTGSIVGAQMFEWNFQAPEVNSNSGHFEPCLTAQTKHPVAPS